MNQQKKHKLYSLGIGIILTTICLILFFLDKSLEWNATKISSCIIASIWLFFFPPTILYYDYKSKKSDMQYNIHLGVMIGLGCFLGFLFAPIIGTIAYFSNLEELKE